MALQPAAEAEGIDELSVTRYPVTPVASVAVKVVIATVSEVEVAGIVNPVTTGAVVSGRVIVIVSLRGAETFPAASLAQA